ncbi:Ferredoxin_Fd3 [Hexamita inflata]|uniref:Ferredoxin_Fd3 n=1 Tax=Hexamita inflata TaxID=28002 RepID=A0ABP1HJE2_9EUKA
MDVNRSRHRLLIVEQRCIGCGNCVIECPVQVLQLHPVTKKVRIVYQELCIGCYSCVQVCPSDATCLEDPYTMLVQ